MICGRIREAVHTYDIRMLLPNDINDKTYDYIAHRGTAWLAPMVRWKRKGEDFGFRSQQALWWISDGFFPAWELWCGDKRLLTWETFDLQKAQHRWSIVPLWDNLWRWWSWADGALERGEISQEIYDAPINALVAKWRWCNGEINTDALDAARAAATQASIVARDTWGDIDASTMANHAARVARVNTDVARDAAHAMARAAAYDIRFDDWNTQEEKRDELQHAVYQEYCDRFRDYIWQWIHQ